MLWAYCPVCKKTEEVPPSTVVHHHIHDGMRNRCEFRFTPPRKMRTKKDVGFLPGVQTERESIGSHVLDASQTSQHRISSDAIEVQDNATERREEKVPGSGFNEGDAYRTRDGLVVTIYKITPKCKYAFVGIFQVRQNRLRIFYKENGDEFFGERGLDLFTKLLSAKGGPPISSKSVALATIP